MAAKRLWKLGIAAMKVRDRRTGRLKVRIRLLWGRRMLLGLDHHTHPACGMRWAWHIHLGQCLSLVFCPRPRVYREERCKKRRERK